MHSVAVISLIAVVMPSAVMFLVMPFGMNMDNFAGTGTGVCCAASAMMVHLCDMCNNDTGAKPQ